MTDHPLLRRAAPWLLLAALAGATSCAHDVTGPAAGAAMELTLHGLGPLDPAEGSYELWVYPRTGTPVPAGRFQLAGTTLGGDATIDFELPMADASRIAVTVEPPGDSDSVPSRSELMAGRFDHGAAHLSIEGSVTDGRPLETDPGHHSLFTTSNNLQYGYPSDENSGLWLFSLQVDINKSKTRWVKLTPLQAGWTYEGWIIYRQGTPQEVWIPYGKYRPDLDGFLTSRDNTGSGYFSGDPDYVNGGVEDVPGDEWTTSTVAAHLGLAMPGGLKLPLQLNAVDSATGKAVWHHVITIEPAFDEDEAPLADRPFVLRPYWNPVGAGGPGVPREILYQHNDPSGEVRVAR
ncbi:MAG TPA: anti-sigma factor [Gemmatimonadaceae bacterium]|nr:anti-sigma factor [Gemmatimonadaceae bacterium]